MSTSHKPRPGTRCIELGRHPEKFQGIVNTPVYHASTVTFTTLEDVAKPADKSDMLYYGRFGTPTHKHLEEAVAALEGGFHSYVTPSGLSAITAALLALVEQGSHLLIADTVYGPTRRFCNSMLRRMGVETTFYDPMADASAVEELIRPETRAIFMESPGSQTFELQDVPALCAMARKHGVASMMDNTWASPFFCHPFELGVDISIQAATKYIVGHSDAMLGMVTANRDLDERVRAAVWDLGLTAGPDDCYLALRGIRTLGVRLARHQENALHVARWLESRPEVERVLYPALPSHPQHHIWKRDFHGASGLFGVVLHPCATEGLKAMLEGMRHFAMGYSFGGFESLILPTHPGPLRTATVWNAQGPTLRLHVGLEDPDDLTEDLARGFERLSAR